MCVNRLLRLFQLPVYFSGRCKCTSLQHPFWKGSPSKFCAGDKDCTRNGCLVNLSAPWSGISYFRPYSKSCLLDRLIDYQRFENFFQTCLPAKKITGNTPKERFKNKNSTKNIIQIWSLFNIIGMCLCDSFWKWQAGINFKFLCGFCFVSAAH